MILVPIRCAAKGIRKSIVYIALSISTCKAKNLYTNVSRIWIHQSLFIIDKSSMI